MLNLVPKLKTNKSFKLLLADMKENSSIRMKFEMAGMAENRQERLILIVVPQVRLSKQILNQLAFKKRLMYMTEIYKYDINNDIVTKRGII